MKAEELRIGNWINKDDAPFEITGIAQKYVSYEHSGELTFNFRLEDVKPIELTCEWLERFGFYKQWLDNGTTLRCWDYGINEFHLHGMADDFFTFMTIKINHVHQLQNLYYALTGRELTIKQVV